MHLDRWLKKNVSLTWDGRQTRYAVAQELFSSHDIDAGSKLLLRSLDVASFAAQGRAVDLGCGCGVLGLAWKDRMPGWTVELIDRDALAVAFTKHNAVAMGFADSEVVCHEGLGVGDEPADLILWNVPGKAGEEVLTRLATDTVSVLAAGGLLALVVVHPLVEAIRAGIAADTGVHIEHESAHADHTVMHVRRNGEVAAFAGEPFARGVFDREEAGFGVDDLDYDIVPVVGVPEYDTYSFATQVTFDLLRTVVGDIQTAMILRPGQGHVPVILANQFAPGTLILVDRDLLALRASERALIAARLVPPVQRLAPAVDITDVVEADSVELGVLLLEDQVRNEVHVGRLDDLAVTMVPGGQVVVGGTSSTVSRFLAHAAKAKVWKLRDRTRRSGASAARLEYVPRG